MNLINSLLTNSCQIFENTCLIDLELTDFYRHLFSVPRVNLPVRDPW